MTYSNCANELARQATVGLVIARDGRAPAGADEAVAEAHGMAVVVGRRAAEAAALLPSAVQVWWAETGTGPAGLAAQLAPVLSAVTLVVVPASPDGRDIAPRLAGAMDRPLLAGAVRAGVSGDSVTADLLRADGRVVVTATTTGPAVATLLAGARGPRVSDRKVDLLGLVLGSPPAAVRDAESVALIEPDPATMDLAEARRVFAGGAGLVPPGATDAQARAIMSLLAEVATALGASAGATRVVTDAGWMGYDRQIGTTGVAVDPDVYVAFGVSGASQHVGGIGAPRVTISVNTDPSCPMTSMADLGVVSSAPSLLVEVALRMGVPVSAELLEVAG